MTVLDPHLDTDQLSAAVDGDAAPEVAAHLAGCAACRHQVETWRRTLATLRLDRLAGEAADPEEADPTVGAGAGPIGGDGAGGAAAGAVATALAAWDADRASERAAAALSARAGRPRPIPRRWGAALGAVAAAAGVGLLVGLVHLGGGSASTATGTSTAAGASAASGSASGGFSAASGSASGGATSATGGAGAGPAPPVHADTGMQAALAHLGRVDGAPALLADLRPLLHSRTAGGAPVVAAGDQPCLRQADRVAGATGPAAVAASLSWQGQPAVVLVVALPSGTEVAEVLRTDCQLLTGVAVPQP